jgi:hypothetical protein
MQQQQETPLRMASRFDTDPLSKKNCVNPENLIPPTSKNELQTCNLSK